MVSLEEQNRTSLTDHSLNPPYGGELVDLMVLPGRRLELQRESRAWPSWNLTRRQLCDLELLLNGGFSPLRGFMARADYESSCRRMRLADGTIWPVPIVLDVTGEFARTICPGASIALRDPEGLMLATLGVEEIWQSDQCAEQEALYGTASSSLPAALNPLEHRQPWYIGGRVEGIQPVAHFDFQSWRLTPFELRAEFMRIGWHRVIAFDARSTMHRAHYELTLRAAKAVEANLLIHPSVGMASPGDPEQFLRLRCYQALLSRYPSAMANLRLLPLAPYTAGPREALWHAIVRKNYGCSHLIVNPSGSTPANNEKENSLFGPCASPELLRVCQEQVGITLVPCSFPIFLEKKNRYVPEEHLATGARPLTITETELRTRLSQGREIPSWFTFPEITRELRRSRPPRSRQGFTVFFTGFSGAGKSTIANILLIRLSELGERPVTLLDGDIVRKHLSSELGFSREHRDINIRRIGFVASLITKNRGIAICAPIAPYDLVRKEVRAMIEPLGGFVLVHFSTPLEVCEKRDPKGLYAKARAGLVQHFTGISDPYDPPVDADIVLDTSKITPQEVAQQIFLYLEQKGFVRANGRHTPSGFA